MDNSFDKAHDLILFYSPESAIDPHFTTQCYLAKTLQELGYKVIMARCTGVFFRCPVMDMFKLGDPPQKEESCAICRFQSKKMQLSYNLQFLELGDFVTPDIINILNENTSKIANDPFNFEFDGIKFGKLCSSDVVLAKKEYQFDGELRQDIHASFIYYINSALLSYLLADTLFKTLPIKRILYFNEYSLFHAAGLAAQKNGILVSAVTLAPHQNNDRRQIVIMHDLMLSEFLERNKIWDDWRNLRLSKEQIQGISRDSLMRFGCGGNCTYSPSKTLETGDIRAKFGIPKGRKLLVAYTSSFDEFFATSYHLEGANYVRKPRFETFKTQIEWLQALLDLVSRRDDLYLIIRIHPREGSGERNAAESAHLQQLRKAFPDTYQNCRIIWPTENTSSYDLGEQADLVLVSWSTIGLEMARLGVPTLAMTQEYWAFPKDDFLEYASTPKEYFEKIGLLLKAPPLLKTIKHAYRWYFAYALANALDFSDVIENNNFSGIPPFKLSESAKTLEDVIINHTSTDDFNLQKQRTLQATVSNEEEESALRCECRRIIHFLCCAKLIEGDNKLLLVQCSDDLFEEISAQHLTEINPQKINIILYNSTGLLKYFNNEELILKTSPMAIRLALLSANDFMLATNKQELADNLKKITDSISANDVL